VSDFQRIMPTLELDFNQVDQVISETAKRNFATGIGQRWLEEFFENVERRALTLYNGARLEARRIYDPERATAHWQAERRCFEGIYFRLLDAESKLSQNKLPEIDSLESAIKTVAEIVEACRGTHEPFA
jgi:hypothetical protein